MGDVGRRIRERRLECGLSAAETARRAEISRPYLHKIENADKDVAVSADVLFRLGRALSTNASWILGRNPEDQPPPLPPMIEQYLRSHQKDLGMLAFAATVDLQPLRRDLTRDDWITLGRALIATILGLPDDERVHADVRWAASLVDEVIAEDDRQRTARIWEAMIRRFAQSTLQVFGSEPESGDAQDDEA